MGGRLVAYQRVGEGPVLVLLHGFTQDSRVRYVGGMFSDSPPREAREQLAGIMADFHPMGFRLMAAALAGADTRDLLPRIRVPTLLVWGDADARSPVSVAYQFRDALPGARLALIPGVGHVSNLEAPTQFNALVRGFCSDGPA